MTKIVNDALRAKYVEALTKMLEGAGEYVLRTGTGEIALPVVDSAGEDNYVVITIKVPTGSRDGEAYDAFSMAEDYKMHCEEKAEKAKKQAEAKAKKIARDKAQREAKAKAKAEHQAEQKKEEA